MNTLLALHQWGSPCLTPLFLRTAGVEVDGSGEA